MILRYETTKVFIICPANIATGGPELLHQLAYQLNKLEIDAYMFYLPEKVDNPVHANYVKYQVPFVRAVENLERNVIVVPESYLWGIYEKRFSKMQKVVWWLSVDNYLSAVDELISRHKRKKLYWIKSLFNYYNIPDMSRIRTQESLNHWAQSEYARQFLAAEEIKNIEILSDYLSAPFFEDSDPEAMDKEDWILYNPKKGYSFTQQLIRAAPGLSWRAIENLGPYDVLKLLRKSKVYVDFGNHPGKDRLPREAAILGCCIITGKQGSAGNPIDIPISKEFKFSDSLDSIPLVISQIKLCLANFEAQSAKFADYRESIKNEEQAFVKDLKRIFYLS